MVKLTRREFIKKGGALVAGGVAAASGVLAIVAAEPPADPEVVHWLSSKPWLEYGRGMMDGMIEGINTSTGTAQSIGPDGRTIYGQMVDWQYELVPDNDYLDVRSPNIQFE